jgi:hypothetical protein
MSAKVREKFWVRRTNFFKKRFGGIENLNKMHLGKFS